MIMKDFDEGLTEQSQQCMVYPNLSSLNSLLKKIICILLLPFVCVLWNLIAFFFGLKINNRLKQGRRKKGKHKIYWIQRAFKKSLTSIEY